MGWREKANLGHDLIAEVHEVLKIEDSWCIDHGEGFTWWGDALAQHVWCDPSIFHNGESIYKVHIESDLLRGRGRAQGLDVELQRAHHEMGSFSGVIYDPKIDTYRLHASMYATESHRDWQHRLVCAAAALQVAEAHLLVRDLAERLHAVPAVSEHPRHGMRTAPSPLLASVHGFFKPQGQLPSKWVGTEEWAEVKWILDRETMDFDTDNNTCWRGQYEWYSTEGQEIIVECTTEELHPILGSGLHFSLSIPLKLSSEGIAMLAMELNDYERREWKRAHMLGSWCNHGGKLCFRSFVPNTLYNPQVLPQLTVSMSVRAQWANEFFFEKKQQAQRAAVSPQAEAEPADSGVGF